jgi:hypothetical protein
LRGKIADVDGNKVGFGNYNWPLSGSLFWPHLN